VRIGRETAWQAASVRVLRLGILTDREDRRFLSHHWPVLAAVQPCAR